jgi:hypothetical protein
MIALMSENNAVVGPVNSPAWWTPWLVNRAV